MVALASSWATIPLVFLTNVDWADRLSQNVTKELLPYAVLYPRREQISLNGLVMQA